MDPSLLVLVLIGFCYGFSVFSDIVSGYKLNGIHDSFDIGGSERYALHEHSNARAESIPKTKSKKVFI